MRWAFERLPAPASKVLPDIDVVSTSPDWKKKIASIQAVISVYKDYIAENNILPELDIRTTELSNELVWAERLEAWSNPNWRDWITRCEEKAVKSGYPAREFWVWSLWGWTEEKPNKSMNTDKQ